MIPCHMFVAYFGQAVFAFGHFHDYRSHMFVAYLGQAV